MAHSRLLFVGGRDNLQKIFDNCPDSSAESAAEMTIGADWIEDYDWLPKKEKELKWTTDDFTKESDPELYEEILNGIWEHCYDIRDPNRYGSFDCLNCPDFEPFDNLFFREREERNKKRVIELIKTLPENTLFHFADSHW